MTFKKSQQRTAPLEFVKISCEILDLVEQLVRKTPNGKIGQRRKYIEDAANKVLECCCLAGAKLPASRKEWSYRLEKANEAYGYCQLLRCLLTRNSIALDQTKSTENVSPNGKEIILSNDEAKMTRAQRILIKLDLLERLLDGVIERARKDMSC